MSDASDIPLFDSTRAALVFALNAEEVRMPRPVATKAMAEVPVKKKRKRKAASVLDATGAAVVLEREASARSRPPGHGLHGLDASGQAGFILAQLNRLDLVHSTVLTGMLTTPADACSCRRPCCSGWWPRERWVDAVKRMCHILKESGDVIPARPGKKGLGTHPALRQAIVQGVFRGRLGTLDELAVIAGGMSLKTVAKHRSWVVEFMEQAEGEAWQAADLILSQANIVGTRE